LLGKSHGSFEFVALDPDASCANAWTQTQERMELEPKMNALFRHKVDCFIVESINAKWMLRIELTEYVPEAEPGVSSVR
jgi:hypothetical protein